MKTKIHKILIANRGEIAVRIIRACKEMGIRTVAIFSEADRNSMHVRLADEAICIGGPLVKDSYLNMISILNASDVLQVDAIHPGVGFLSENEKFVRICESCNINFIGPKSETIRLVGDKSRARQVMKQHKIPVIEGYEGTIDSIEQAKKIADEIGYPLMIKAVLGGGGKGIRIVESTEMFESAYTIAVAEAKACFGDDRIYMEKYIKNAKHIEFQILADEYGNRVQLGERQCSLQRSNQKVLEEAPAAFLSKSLREEMGRVALRVAEVIDYVNAGTVEFILDEDNNYYFMEVNTRIQVEHPITEMITGIDLIKEQIKISCGERLSISQDDIQIRGHAIECRINAEDPSDHYKPSVGKIDKLIMPDGMGIRVDSSIYGGYTIPPYYDSMIAKVIAYDVDRKAAINKMKRALDEIQIEGIKTNLEFQKWLLEQEAVSEDDYTTDFLAKNIFI